MGPSPSGVLNPERNTNVRKASRYLLTGLIHCGDCGGALFSRPRNNTRRYLCAGRRPGHQLGIVADPVDELVKEFVFGLLSTPSVREALLVQAGAGDDGTMGRALADVGAAQTRLQALDDDFYVRGVPAEGRYRSIRVKLEREIDPTPRRGRRRDHAAHRPAPRSPCVLGGGRLWTAAGPG